MPSPSFQSGNVRTTSKFLPYEWNALGKFQNWEFLDEVKICQKYDFNKYSNYLLSVSNA